MSETKMISPMLDDFDVGSSISDHNGVSCYPAMRKNSDDRYIVKTISIPASQTQLDALLLTGAYPDAASAMSYFKELADATVDELETLQKLSLLEGYLPYENWQVVAKEDSIGFDVYMMSSYKRTLRKQFQRQPMTHLMAVNLGLDLCAALAVCRRCGYLYVALKPNNIFVVGEKEYKIGDLGFVRLDSLKFASLPDRYRSVYTAPELSDPFATLNATIDVYALGLILYQAYNGGELPFSDTAPQEKLAPPIYADYEMTEIILKACDPNPEERWQDPIEMGQAIVSYMQRNGANDTPIVTIIPQTPVTPAEDILSDSTGSSEPQLTGDEIDLSDIDLSDIPELSEADHVESAEEDMESEALSAEADVVPAEDIVIPEDQEDLSSETPIYTEDGLGNMTFLDEVSADETSPENNISDVDYDEISDELSEILSQADELASHPVPEPAVAPDPVDVPVPEPIIVSEELSEDTAVENTSESSSDADAPVSDEQDAFNINIEEDVSLDLNDESADDRHEDVAASEDEEEGTSSTTKKSTFRILRNIIIFLLIAIVAVAGFIYYKFVYLQTIYNITVDGDESSMVVHVDSDTDEALLSVVCSDSHGNQLSAPVVDGTATFANLAPDTAYNVRVMVDGFHRLTGETAVSYSTPAQTNIVQFSAVTGPEDGSVILGFTVEGPDTGVWSVKYSAADEEEKTVELLSHMATLTGLTVGKEYTFTLIPGNDMYVTGTDQITFTASNLVYAQDVVIVSCIDGKLTASWTAPEDASVSNWTVRCYNDGDYNETIITSECTAVFEGVDAASAHTVEVTAAGMSVSQRAYMAENAITVSNFTADTSSASALTLSWDSSSTPEGGWVLLYSVDGSETQGSVACADNSARISPMVPGATYSFTLQQASGDPVLALPLSCETPDAQDFSGYGMTRNSMTYDLCRSPEGNWDWDDISTSDYTNTFQVGEEISIVAKLYDKYGISDDTIVSLFVFRDTDGNVVSYCHSEKTWSDMWYQSYSEIDVPQAPTQPGEYVMSIYFNGKLVTEEDVTIVSE